MGLWGGGMVNPVLLEEGVTGAEDAVEAGGEPGDVCGDVGQDLGRRLVEVGDLGDIFGDLQDAEAGTQHLSPVVALCRRVCG